VWCDDNDGDVVDGDVIAFDVWVNLLDRLL